MLSSGTGRWLSISLLQTASYVSTPAAGNWSTRRTSSAVDGRSLRKLLPFYQVGGFAKARLSIVFGHILVFIVKKRLFVSHISEVKRVSSPHSLFAGEIIKRRIPRLLYAVHHNGPHFANFNHMKTLVARCSVAFLILAGPALMTCAAQTANQDIKNAGRSIKNAGKETGEAAKDTGKATATTAKTAGRKVKRASKKVVNKTADKTAEGANKIKEKTQ